MSPEATLAAIVLGPLIILMALRVNAALVFLSLCLGNVLVQFVAGEAKNLFSQLDGTQVTQIVQIDNVNVKLVLLLLPVVLTTIFMIRTILGKSRLLLNLLPAAGVGLLGALLVVPLLPRGLSHNIVDSSLWTHVLQVQNVIVAGSAVVCLIVLWLQRPKAGHKHRKHKA